jgi:hypothetical protein
VGPYSKSSIHKNTAILWRFFLFVLLIGSLSARHALGQSRQLQFERITLDVNGLHADSGIQNQVLIDSVFTLSARDLLEFERLLGYKLSGQLYIQLFDNNEEYQSTLMTHPVWRERFTSEFLGISTNHYPVYVGTTLEDIHIQLKYLIAHIVINEFLNGSSVRQKMTQSGFHQFPSWVFQGLCAQWANGWNIQAEDEYAYYNNKGAFHSPNAVEPLSAQVFGRKIWHAWRNEFGDAAITNFWFILKYTGKASTAVEFLTGETYKDWYQHWKASQMQVDDAKFNTDFSVLSHRSNAPILRLYRKQETNDLMVQFYIPDEEYWAIESTKNAAKPTVIHQKSHAKLLTECAYYLHRIEENKQGENVRSNPVNSQSNFELKRTPIDATKDELSLVQLRENSSLNIWIDTIPRGEVVRDLIIESKDVVSHIQSKDNQWFINFTKLNDSTIIRCKIPVIGGFARQFIDDLPGEASKVIESSFHNNHASLRWLDIGTLSPTEITEMIRMYPRVENQISEVVSTNSQDSLIQSSVSNPWTFISPYPVVPNRKSSKTLTLHQYERGKVRYTQGQNAFMFERGGLFLGNEEAQAFPNLASIEPNSLYNHPLTPEIRFYLSDPKRGHQMKAGLLSNLPMSRMAARIEQSWKLRNYEIRQSFHHRTRDYYVRETTLFQTIGDQLLLGLAQQRSESLQLGIDAWYQRDFQFQRISRPFSNLKDENQLRSKNIKAYFHFQFKSNNATQARRMIGNLSGSLGAYHYTNTSNTLGLGYDFQLIGKFKKPISNGIVAECNAYLNSSTGKVRSQFWVGGSQGWINPAPWQLDYLSATEKENSFGYRMVGGYVRGFFAGARLGHSSAVINAQISMLPYALLHQNLSKSTLLQHLNIYGFFDMGTAYIGRGIGDTKNPFNLEEIEGPNYKLKVFAKRNPWIAGTGFGISTEILRVPIRYEVAWGLKEGKVLTPIQYVCTTWNF